MRYATHYCRVLHASAALHLPFHGPNQRLVSFANVTRACRLHGGYECKEGEPGKFTLAFFHCEYAMRFAAHLHAGERANDGVRIF